MKKILPLLLVFSMLVTSCITFGSKTEAPTEIIFVTSTLPPTKVLVSRLSPTAGVTGTPGTPTLAVTVPADCKVVAVLIEDVTIPDGTQISRGKSFTKTWKFKNTGTCPWQGYQL
ncbi:MAG TPA: NBR1-Ig-like domain-containing protein, partial [Anaerolineales bacterium]